ncbi:MAG: NAD-dependent epimerase/dehydratase family protein [Segetibacter sp.]|nr:NAD-dependent epimerase/dehydratase family protein [Segetibacter sp.]
MKKDKVTFILIGAAGFLGSAFSNYLLQNKYKVYKILRGQISGIDSDFHLIAELLKIDDEKLIVVDFAYTSVPNSSSKDPVRDYSENLYNVIRHLEFVKQLPNATYIYISSGGTVYGNPGKHEPIKETYTNNPLSPYGITKLACEKYVLMYKENFGLDVKIVRASNIYGPGQRPFRGQGIIATAIAKALVNDTIQIFGDGSQVRDYLYIEDFCRVLYDVVEFGENGTIYNTGSGMGHTIKSVLENIERVLGNTLSVMYLPSRSFDVRYNVLDSSKVSILNNWSPAITLKEGISTTLEWIRDLKT